MEEDAGVNDSFAESGFYSGDPVRFAIRPLSTGQLSGTVDGTAYRDVELDLWARNFLQCFDTILSAGAATASNTRNERSGTSYYLTLIALKETLASRISAGLTHVLVDQADDGGLPLARRALKNSLLDNLASAFSIPGFVRINDRVNVADPCVQLPLRHSPGTLQLVRQSGIAADMPATPDECSGSVIADALGWRCDVEVAHAWAHHDKLCFNLTCNVSLLQNGDAASTANISDPQQALLTSLARFEQGAIEIQRWIDLMAAPARTAQIDYPPNQSALDIARIVELIEKVTDAWPNYEAEPEAPLIEILDVESRYDFILQLDEADPKSVSLYGSWCEEEAPIWPVLIDKEGRMGKCGSAEPHLPRSPLSGAEAMGVRWFRRAYRFDEVPNADGWTFRWSPLSLLDRHSVRFSARVIRNANLSAVRCTNPEFIYRTSTVTFPNLLIPLIQRESLPKMKPRSSLAQTLLHIFEPFSGISTIERWRLRIESTFSYPINPASPGIRVRVPVLFFQDHYPSGSDAVLGLAKSLALQHSEWYERIQQQTEADEFHLALSIFKTDNEGGRELPVVRFDDIPISVESLPGWWREEGEAS